MTYLLTRPGLPSVLILPVLLTLLVFFGQPATALHAQGCTVPVTVSDKAQLNAAIGCFNGQTAPGEYVISLGVDIALSAATTAINNSNAGVSLRIDGATHTVDDTGEFPGDDADDPDELDGEEEDEQENRFFLPVVKR
jgi:hypothetical protein